MRGTLYIVAAPSGAGKSSLVNAVLAKEPGIALSISFTSRAPRPGERHAQHYHFVDKAEFERMIAAGDFFEHALVHGDYKGTARQSVEPQLAAGKVFYNYRDEAIPVEELSGHSVFAKDAEGRVFHTYSAFGRGAEELLGTYMFLDLTPKGRNENGRGNLTDWVRHHDRYGVDGHVDAAGRFVADEPSAAPCCAREARP